MANVTGSILSSILYIWSVRALLSAASRLFIFNWAMFKRIFSYGIYSTLQVIFGILMSQLDRTLLGIWIGVAAVTTYTIPLSVANRIQQLCAKSLEIVFPLSSGLNAQSRTDQLKHLFLRAQNLNVVLVLMSSIPLIILAPEILKFWISPEFAIETALVFRLLVVAYALLGLIVVPAGMVAGFGHPEVNAGFGVLVGLSNLLGYFLFIPSWGVNGAGIASLFGSLIAVPVFLWYINYRFLKVSLSEIFTAIIVRQALSSIIMAGGLFLIRPFIINPLVLLLALGGSCIIFLVMTVLFGVWQAQELELLRLKWLRVSGG
jgi:O-antigen/teichoic acid export membrane protein